MITDSVVNIASVIEEMANQHPNNVAMYYPKSRGYLTYTYADLLAESDRIAYGLAAIGIERGTRTVLMVKPSLPFFALVFALVRSGIVPIIIDPGMGLKNLKTCLAEAQPEAFIGIPTAHAARIALGWGKDTIKAHITVGRKLFWGGYTLNDIRNKAPDKPFNTVPTQADEMAAIIFTSGSTGVPKGVVYTHGNFMGQIEMLRDTYDIQPGEVDLPTFPVFALFDPALGMTTIIPKMDFTRPATVEPMNIIQPILDFGVTNMFGSPALLNRVGRYGEQHGTHLPSLKRVISAGAPVSGAILDRFSKMLSDDALIYTPYGATEALPVASLDHKTILAETQAKTDEGAGVCIGRVVAPNRVEIIRISDNPIPQYVDAVQESSNSIGEIVVRGPTVTSTYFNRKPATALAKMEDFDGFWHRMGDLGYFDDEGRLWFCGRKAHRVELSEETLFTVPCESVFNTHPKVYRTALVGVNRPAGKIPVLCVETEPSVSKAEHPDIETELLAIAQQYPHTQRIETILFHPSFPVDIRHNAKIFREKLAVWAEKQLS